MTENQAKPILHHLFIIEESTPIDHAKQNIFNGLNDILMRISIIARERKAYHQRVTVATYSGIGMKLISYNKDMANAYPLYCDDFDSSAPASLIDCLGTIIGMIRALNHHKEMVSVTILSSQSNQTSRKYCISSIKLMIQALKRNGWTFNYVSTDRLTDSYAKALSIDDIFRLKSLSRDDGRLKELLHTIAINKIEKCIGHKHGQAA